MTTDLLPDGPPRRCRGHGWPDFITSMNGGWDDPTTNDFHTGFRTVQSGCRQQILKGGTKP